MPGDGLGFNEVFNRWFEEMAGLVTGQRSALGGDNRTGGVRLPGQNAAMLSR